MIALRQVPCRKPCGQKFLVRFAPRSIQSRRYEKKDYTDTEKNYD
jgi:hypothetical protein